MQSSKNLFGYLSIVLFTSGVLFKLQHWPGAAILLLTGVALLNFVFLPMLFFGKKASN